MTMIIDIALLTTILVIIGLGRIVTHKNNPYPKDKLANESVYYLRKTQAVYRRFESRFKVENDTELEALILTIKPILTSPHLNDNEVRKMLHKNSPEIREAYRSFIGLLDAEHVEQIDIEIAINRAKYLLGDILPKVGYEIASLTMSAK